METLIWSVTSKWLQLIIASCWKLHENMEGIEVVSEFC